MASDPSSRDRAKQDIELARISQRAGRLLHSRFRVACDLRSEAAISSCIGSEPNMPIIHKIDPRANKMRSAVMAIGTGCMDGAAYNARPNSRLEAGLECLWRFPGDFSRRYSPTGFHSRLAMRASFFTLGLPAGATG